MYVYRVGIEPGAGSGLAPNQVRARKLGWSLCGQPWIDGDKNRFIALKSTGEFVAGDLRDWVAASSREAYEEFIGLFLPGLATNEQ